MKTCTDERPGGEARPGAERTRNLQPVMTKEQKVGAPAVRHAFLLNWSPWSLFLGVIGLSSLRECTNGLESECQTKEW